MKNLLLLCAAFVSSCCVVLHAADQPNFVHIMVDELGYYELSHMGSRKIKTPNIDRLAAEGLRFTQALAGSSLCAPTRCVLMSGKHSGRTSVRTNGGGTPMRAGEATVASALKQVGYATGGFGKWGCGGRGSTGVPEELGFDTFIGYYDQVHAHSFYPEYIVSNSEELILPGNAGGRSGGTYSHYVIVDEAKQFIRQNSHRPFFCYMPITPPHGMFDIPDSDPAWALYKDESWPEEAKRYAAMITMLDRQVGEVVQLLRGLKLEEKTLVLFSGDNGGNDYFKDADHPRGYFAPNVEPKSGVEFRGTKGTLYEGGLRIPMVLRWPGKIAPGRVSDRLWYFPDIFPTYAELAGAKVPSDLNGISMVPEFLGVAAAGREQTDHHFLYWELGNQVAVRQKNWKAIRPRRRNAVWELYDLNRDVSEKNDLAAKHPEILQRLQSYAHGAHAPAVEGVFHDRADHERDRRAKWGSKQPAARTPSKVHNLPKRGLVSRDAWKVVSASSEAGSRLADHAIDGNPRTHWHTEFSPRLEKHPHEIVIDMGEVQSLSAVHFLARQDGGWNGAIGDVEISLAAASDAFGKPAAVAKLERVRTPQAVAFENAARGRFLKIVVKSEVGGGPWASIAEIGASRAKAKAANR